MDYEKKYNSALERARNYYKGLAPCRAKDELELIFPELRESEDERIAEELIKALRGISIGLQYALFLTEEKKQRWLSWLEKQKINTEGDFGRGYDCGYEACLNSHGAKWFEKQKEQKPAEYNAFKKWVEDYWSHNKVNNPYSYNKGDEVQFDHKGFVSFCEAYCYPQNLVLHDTFGYEEGRQTGQNEGVKLVLDNPEKYGLQKEQKPTSTEEMPYITDEHFYEREPADSFKYKLAEYMTKCCTKKEGPYGYEYGISAESILKMAEEELLKRGVVQKPAEWGEEDEKHLNNILDAIDYWETTSGQGILLDTDINWLKSLRPQYHGDVTMTEAYKMGLEAGKASSWKPSEDEERLINTSISFLKDFADKGYENAVECIDWLKSKLKNGNSGK